MLRVSGRKYIELAVPMCNSVEREIDHSTASADTDAAAKRSNAAQKSDDDAQTARSQRDFLKLGRRVSACACDGRA